jgi:integrase
VTSPDADVPWIVNLARRIKRKARPVKPTAQRRCPLIHLIRLGDALMERGQATLVDDPSAGALMFRDGLMIVTEVALPLRRKNMASLRLGASLFRDENGYRVKFTGDEMKNGQDFEGRYPDSLTPALDAYFDTIRPILRAGSKSDDDGSLWLGRWGEPMIGASISLRLRELTQRHISVPFAAHSFRHSAATDIALLDPKHVGIVKSVLGHASPLSADYYNLASGFEAASRYQALLADLRKNDRDT